MTPPASDRPPPATPDGRQLLLPGLGATGHLPWPGDGAIADGNVRLTAAAARRLACDCAVHRVVMGPGNIPIAAGPRVRLVPTTLRRLVVARDGHCRFPGCDAPPRWTEAHHVKFWSEGGKTELLNLLLLCPWHHHRVHDHGWTLNFDGKTVIVHRPDGTRLTAPGDPGSPRLC